MHVVVFCPLYCAALVPLALDVPHIRKMCAVVHAVAVLTCRRILSESMHHESILYCTLLANELNILLHSFCHSRAQTFQNDLQACKPLVQFLSLMRQKASGSHRPASLYRSSKTQRSWRAIPNELYCTRMEKLGTTSHGQTA